jgi:hypothetical protein
LKRHAATRSRNGNDLAYWAANAVWETLPASEHLEHINIQAISRLAEEQGESPSHSLALASDLPRSSYHVDAAATASRRDQSQKVIQKSRNCEQHVTSLCGICPETFSEIIASSLPTNSFGI